MTKNSQKRPETLKIPNVIIITAKLISLFSTKLLVWFVARLFTTPIKHRLPKRELEMDGLSIKSDIFVPAIKKEIVVYQYGTGNDRILLVHGWSGRGTQLAKFADSLIERGNQVFSFDAPAHGKSTGSTTLMPEFIESIIEIEKRFGPFKAAIGHSLGGMSLLNAMRMGFKIDYLVIIGSGDIIKDIFDDFILKMRLEPRISDLMRDYFEHKFQKTMSEFSSYLSAKTIDIPVLVIHDEDDAEVSVKCAHHILENLKNGQLMITKKLGHRKILGDAGVIKRSLEFIKV